jgi:hypothetical protein
MDDPELVELAVWAFGAFWLWLGLTALLRQLGVPLPQLSAAILGWVAAGLSLPWVLPRVEHWLQLSSVASHWLLTML